ncbi:thioesterase family protein [Tistrella bauzanensis]|uniref:Thioesterase family protein n=1 Tax=Tistrella arctica TaxID=3133430 RepID=A0ABU9YDV1_9PROT
MARAHYSYFHPFEIRFSEVDMHGHVFNGRYLDFFDTAVTGFLIARGCDEILSVDGAGNGTGTADAAAPVYFVRRAGVEFLAPVRFRQRVEVGVGIARMGRSSLSFALEVHGEGEDAPRARGEIVWVAVDRATGRSAELPASLRDKLAPALLPQDAGPASGGA